MSMAQFETRPTPKACRISIKHVLLHPGGTPDKAAHVGPISRDLNPIQDVGTLRINADSRTASGTTDSSHGVLVEEEEVQSPATPDPWQAPETGGGTPTVVQPDPCPVPTARAAAMFKHDHSASPPTGCGFLKLFFGNRSAHHDAPKPPAKGGATGTDDSATPPPARKNSMKSMASHRGGRDTRSSSSSSNSTELHGSQKQGQHTSATSGASRSGTSQGSTLKGGESLRNRFAKSPVPGLLSQGGKHKSSSGHRSRSSKGESSQEKERDSQHSSKPSHNLDVYLARERYAPFSARPSLSSSPLWATTTVLRLQEVFRCTAKEGRAASMQQYQEAIKTRHVICVTTIVIAVQTQ